MPVRNVVTVTVRDDGPETQRERPWNPLRDRMVAGLEIADMTVDRAANLGEQVLQWRILDLLWLGDVVHLANGVLLFLPLHLLGGVQQDLLNVRQPGGTGMLRVFHRQLQRPEQAYRRGQRRDLVVQTKLAGQDEVVRDHRGVERALREQRAVLVQDRLGRCAGRDRADAQVATDFQGQPEELARSRTTRLLQHSHVQPAWQPPTAEGESRAVGLETLRHAAVKDRPQGFGRLEDRPVVVAVHGLPFQRRRHNGGYCLSVAWTA